MMVPHRTPFFLPLLYPSNLLWRIRTAEKELYLTFDDGPVYGPTEFVLEQLNQYNAKATFFCIGDNIRKHPGVFQQIVEAGHAVGNHTFNHLNGWKVGLQQYRDNTDLCQQQIESIRGNVVEKKLFRPPYGRITRRQIGALNDYRIVMWDVLSIDYNKNLSPERCFHNTIAATRPGSIIVFHDSVKAGANLYTVLPRYLDYFSKLGFVFKSLT